MDWLEASSETNSSLVSVLDRSKGEPLSTRVRSTLWLAIWETGPPLCQMSSQITVAKRRPSISKVSS